MLSDKIVAHETRYNHTNHYCDNPATECGSYDHYNEEKDGRFLIPELASGSDYSGGSVTQANYNVLREMDGVHELYGGYGAYAVCIDTMTAGEDVEDALASLADYPVLSEDETSEIELEAENEAWSSWAARDFKREILSRYSEAEDALDSLSDDSLNEIFRNACEAGNQYWENEEGNSAWINLGRVADAIPEKVIATLIGPCEIGSSCPHGADCGAVSHRAVTIETDLSELCKSAS